MRIELKNWPWGIFLVLLALAPAFTKVGGTAWFFMAAAGLWALATRRTWRPESPEDVAIWRAARIWFGFCGVAFLFKAIGVSYWGDPWSSRHFDLRVLFTALSLWVFVTQLQLTQARKNQLVAATFAAAAIAFFVAYRHVNFDIETPSNRINWAGALVMFSWALFPVLASTLYAKKWRFLAAFGVTLLWGAVLMSGVRGAYLSTPWLLVCAVFLCRPPSGGTIWSRWMAIGTVSFALTAIGMFLVAPKVLEVPMQRIDLAVQEARMALVGDERGGRDVDTPVGSRLYMWQRSMEVFKESPWIGYGRAQRIAFIKEWGAEADAHIVSSQSHLHNEYINGMVDHGLVGLASTLSYILGLIAVALSLRREFPLMALSVGGIAFTHITMSMTNANSQTNNYSVMFGLVLTVVFLLRVRRTAEG